MARNHRVTDVLAEKLKAASTRCWNRRGCDYLNITAMDGGKMVDAISLLEQGRKRPRTSAWPCRRYCRRRQCRHGRADRQAPGCARAVLIFPLRQGTWKRIPEADGGAPRREDQVADRQAIRPGRVLMERVEMAPDGKGAVGTGQFGSLGANSLVLAVGQHSDVEFLKTVLSGSIAVA